MAIAAHEGLQQSQPLYPPSGVLPFHGLAAYLAPLCYLYSSPAALYAVWHAMYCQHWCYLHTLSSSPAPRAGLAVLCRTFQNLLQVGLVCVTMCRLGGGGTAVCIASDVLLLVSPD